jgi:hypothetical protein
MPSWWEHERILPRYPSGRRVWLFVRTGRWWLHVEVYHHAFHLGTAPRKQPRLFPWQRRRNA